VPGLHEDVYEHIHLGGELDPAVYVGERVELRSVGIDIGSSTSHLVFSRLLLERQGRHLSSRYAVTRREVVWRSPVILTPYASARRIDAASLGRFVDGSYRAAGLLRGQVDTGAVIITGEAARKDNAGPILDLFAAEAGKFVCATAGPHLESLLAAHGSGAAALSAGGADPVLNVDIGGGTTKFAVCRGGRVEETAAIHVGARLLAWDEADRLVRVEEAGRRLAAEAGWSPRVGGGVTPDALDGLAEAMARRILHVVEGGSPSDLGELWITEPLRSPGPFRKLVFSGGVAEYVYGRENRAFGDLGPRLGRAVLAGAQAGGAEVLEAREGIRATCIGASQYTVQVSGNTIYVSPHDVLPLRNVPVAAVRGFGRPEASRVAEAVQRALGRLDLAAGRDLFALAVHWHHGVDYPSLRELCAGIAGAVADGAGGGGPLVVVLDADVAGLVGRMLREEFGVAGPLACIDQVALREFDYVDVGAPLPDQGVVPVVVKSLVFH
jgi:ethanolamine utilization protein EutA